MKEQNSTPVHPFCDITSIDVSCQIQNQLEAALALCDLHIHYREPKNEIERQESFWGIRILLESALYKYNYLSLHPSVK